MGIISPLSRVHSERECGDISKPAVTHLVDKLPAIVSHASGLHRTHDVVEAFENFLRQILGHRFIVADADLAADQDGSDVGGHDHGVTETEVLGGSFMAPGQLWNEKPCLTSLDFDMVFSE